MYLLIKFLLVRYRHLYYKISSEIIIYIIFMYLKFQYYLPSYSFTKATVQSEECDLNFQLSFQNIATYNFVMSCTLECSLITNIMMTGSIIMHN